MYTIVVTETEDWATIAACKNGGRLMLMASITHGDIHQETEDTLATVVKVARLGGLRYEIVRQRG